MGRIMNGTAATLTDPQHAYEALRHAWTSFWIIELAAQRQAKIDHARRELLRSFAAMLERRKLPDADPMLPLGVPSEEHSCA